MSQELGFHKNRVFHLITSVQTTKNSIERRDPKQNIFKEAKAEKEGSEYLSRSLNTKSFDNKYRKKAMTEISEHTHNKRTIRIKTEEVYKQEKSATDALSTALITEEA